MRHQSPIAVAALAGAIAAALPAQAADYPVLRGSQHAEAPTMRDFQTEAFSWTGAYAGVLAGTARTEFTPGTAGIRDQYGVLDRQLQNGRRYSLSAAPAFRIGEDSGTNFGGFIGYNFAFGDAIIGFEADYTRLGHDYLSANNAVTLTPTTGVGGAIPGVVTASQKLDDYGSLRLRLGYAIDRFMPYASFGLAVGRGLTQVNVAAAPAGAIPINETSREKNSYMYGLTAGFGVDAVIAQNVLLRAEYLFTRFDSFAGTTVDVNAVRLGAGVKF